MKAWIFTQKRPPKKKVIFLFLVVAGLFFIVPLAYAAEGLAENYCFPVAVNGRCWGAMQVIENYAMRFFNGAKIETMKIISTVIWLLDRAAAFVYSKSIPDNAWLLNIRSQMMGLFSGIMPNLLRQAAFGGNGLMYVALSLAGLLMMIPFWGMGARFVRTERVIIWGVLLMALFVGGTFGYDFIGAVEGFRQDMVEGIVGQGGDAMPLDRLLLQPMRAGDGDLGFDEALTLPPVFESSYFPAPELSEVTISAGGGIGFGLGNALVELAEDIEERASKAGWGVFYAFISLLGAWLLVVLGMAYIVLAFTALVLILFLFAALPLGFFEFGGMLLNDILMRYFKIVVQSLTLAIFMQWLSTGLGFIVEVNTATNALLWAVIVVVMTIIAGTFLNGSIKLMLESGKVFSSMGASFGGPSAMQRGGSVLKSGVGAAATVVAAGAALTGNIPTAIAAGQISGLMRNHLGGGRVLQDPQKDYLSRGNVFVDNGAGEINSGGIE